MAKKKGRLFPYSHEHPLGVPLEFDVGTDMLDDTNLVIATVRFQHTPTDPDYLYPGFPLSSGFGFWGTVKNLLHVTPALPGIYTVLMVAHVYGRPLSFRSLSVKVDP